MPALTINAIPEELLDLLRESAQAHRRSINSEAIACLEKALLAHAIEPEAFLAEVDALRSRLALPALTDKQLRRTREEGRP